MSGTTRTRLKRQLPSYGPLILRPSGLGLLGAFVVVLVVSFLLFLFTPPDYYSNINPFDEAVGTPRIGTALAVGLAISLLYLPVISYTAAAASWHFRQLTTRRHPQVRNGLDVGVALPHLLTLIPEDQLRPGRVAQRRFDLFSHLAATHWVLLLTLFVVVSTEVDDGWATGLRWTILAYVNILAYAYTFQAYLEFKQLLRFGDLVIDLHRFELYKALRWPLPSDAEEEAILGRALSKSLQEGFVGLGDFSYHHNDGLSVATTEDVTDAVRKALPQPPAFTAFDGWLSVRFTVATPVSMTEWTLTVILSAERPEGFSHQERVQVDGEQRAIADFELRVDSDVLLPVLPLGLPVKVGDSAQADLVLKADAPLSGDDARVWVSLAQRGEVIQVLSLNLLEHDRLL